MIHRKTRLKRNSNQKNVSMEKLAGLEIAVLISIQNLIKNIGLKILENLEEVEENQNQKEKKDGQKEVSDY